MSDFDETLPRAVFLKQSGELLTSRGSKEFWTPAGIRETGEKIARAYRLGPKLGIAGMTLVSGAGNFGRGNTLKEHGIAGDEADMVGRIFLIANAVAIYHSLKDSGVPVQRFLTEKMDFVDQNTSKFAKYTPEDVRQAHDEGNVVLIAGGTGEDNVTTDNSVVFYAQDYSTVASDRDITILKGTKHDGIFDKNPDISTHARRYKQISAHTVLDNYDRLGAVDESSLGQLIKSGLSMLVYSDGIHDIETVLSHDPRLETNGNSIGTLIVPYECESLLAVA